MWWNAPNNQFKTTKQISETIHFKMETLQTALNLVKGEISISVDLKDTYFIIPIHRFNRNYLRFIWRNKNLPFGLKSSEFHQMYQTHMSFLRTQGHQGVIYINESQIAAGDWVNVYAEL